MATTAAPALLEKDEQIIHPTRTKTKSDPPLDFSFLNITSLKGKFLSDFGNILLTTVLATYLSSSWFRVPPQHLDSATLLIVLLYLAHL